MTTLNRNDLLSAMKRAMPGVDKAGSDKSTDNFLFSEGKLHTCNNFVSVSTPCDMGGLDFAIRAVEFYALVAKSTAETVDIDIADGKKLKFKSGKLRSTLVLSDPAQIHKVVSLVKVGEFKQLPENFADAVHSVRIAKASGRFKGIAILDKGDGSCMCTFDDNAMALCDLSSAMEEMFVDDDTVASSLSLGKPVEYSREAGWLTLRYDSGVDFSCTVKSVNDFPKDSVLRVKKDFDACRPIVTAAFPKDTNEAVGRVAVLASNDQLEGQSTVRLGFSSAGVNVYSKRDSRGDAEELVAWDENSVDGEVPEASVYVPVPFLLEAVHKQSKFSLIRPRPDGNKFVLIFNGDGLSQYVMGTASK